MRSVVYIGRDASTGLSHYGVKGQTWYHRYHQSYEVAPTRSGKVGQEHFHISRSGVNDTVQKRLETAQKKVISQESNLESDAKRQKDAKRNKVLSKLGLMALHTVTLNPVGLAYDFADIGASINSLRRQHAVKNRKIYKIDDKTGFGLKDPKDNTPDEKDVKIVNPKHNNFTESGNSNCMLCSATWEMRKRGYDVTANEANKGYTDFQVDKWFPGAMKQRVSLRPEKSKDTEANISIADKISNARLKVNQDAMWDSLSKQPVGSRGFFNVTWHGSLGGHSMHYEVTKEGPKITDAQTGKIYSKENPYKALNSVSSVDYYRVDNLKFNKDMIKQCCH